MVRALWLCYTSILICNSRGRREGYFHGKIAAPRGASTSVNVTVRGSRDYLTEREVERLIEAAKQNRSGHRDATAILVAYRHGLRASEVVALRWDDIDLATGRLHVRRAKAGDASVHPISARESRALRKLLLEAPPSPYVFISKRRAPLSAAGHQRMVARAGVAAKFTFLVHSHMLRHACGFKLANDGHDTRAIQAYLGHRSIIPTVRYTALTPQSVQAFLEGLRF
jgi:integrase